MKEVIFNIGLNDNPFDFEGVKRKLSNMNSYEHNIFLNDDFVLRDSVYNGKYEPTLVCSGKYYGRLSALVNIVECLCKTFGQECIAVKWQGVGYLVYNVKYKGEKYTFDNNFFIE